MKQQRWGRIIHITSEVFALGVPNFSAYVAAKGGQTGLARSLARELAPWGITVNMIAPGWIPVERHAGRSAGGEGRLPGRDSRRPLGHARRRRRRGRVTSPATKPASSPARPSHVNGGHTVF